MTWQKTQNKYHNTKLMKEFKQWLKKQPKFYRIIEFEHLPIQDVFAWLQCFAETKGYFFYITYDSDLKTFANIQVPNNKHESVLAEKRKFKTQEQAMIWCADKFFEVAE